MTRGVSYHLPRGDGDRDFFPTKTKCAVGDDWFDLTGLRLRDRRPDSELEGEARMLSANRMCS